MILVGITGKSGSGKSYFAEKLAEAIERSSVISIDNVFSRLMNKEQVIDRIVKEYGQSVLKEGKIDLDIILNNKEIFSRIYEIIGNNLEYEVERELKEREKSGEKACIIEWWGLPNTDLVNKCNCSIYIQANAEERLAALKNRETYMTPKSMNERDNVLGTDYASKEYDLVVQNDYNQKVIEEVIRFVKEKMKDQTLLKGKSQGQQPMDITINNAKEVLKKYLMKNKRKLNHSIRVAEVAKILAEKNNVPVDEAVIASLLHDIGKSMTNQEMLELCATREVTMYDFEIFQSPGVLHGKAGAILFEKEFDRESNPEKFDRIKHAISSHVAGADDKMNMLDKIVYVADNIELEKEKKNNGEETQDQKKTDDLLAKIKNGEIENLDDCIQIIIEGKKQRAEKRGVECNPLVDNILNTDDDEISR